MFKKINNFRKRFRLRVRRLFWTWRAKKTVASFSSLLYVNNKSYFSKKTYLGNNVHFNGIRIIGKGKVYIKDNFHSGWGLNIITQYHNYNSSEAIPYDSTYIVKDVVINENVWVGINVTILAGVIIGEGAIIQAGSVVVNDIPPYAIAGGHPAKVFGERNKDVYD